MWYAFTEYGKSIMQKCKMEDVKMSNGFDAQVKPIPDNNTDNNPLYNTDNNTNASETNAKQKIDLKELENDFEEVWKAYPKKQGKEAAKKAYIKARKAGTSHLEIVAGLTKYKLFIQQNKTADKYIKHGSTWFNQKCWEDDYSINQSSANKSTNNTIPTEDDYDFERGSFWK